MILHCSVRFALGMLSLGFLVAAAEPDGDRGPQVFVSPEGKSTGDGTQRNPFDLQTVLNGPKWLRPGTTVWLLGGEYRGEFFHQETCSGTKEKPLVFRVAKDARATIVGGLRILGGHTRFMGFETTNPNAVEVASFFNFYGGDNVSAINLILHDNGAWRRGRNGIGCWSAATNSEVYGCLVYNVGKKGDPKDRGSGGHGIYTQNRRGTGTKRIEDNVFFRGVAWGIHAYGSAKAGVDDFVFRRNIIFRQGSYGALVGGGAPSENIVFERNHFYGNRSTTCCIGWGGKGSTGAQVRGNYFVGNFPLLQFRRYLDATVRENTFVVPQGGMVISVTYPKDGRAPAFSWDTNTYFKGAKALEQFAYRNRKVTDFETWRSLGHDSQSKLTMSRPAENHVSVLPNRHQRGRGHVVVYNWTSKASQEIDLSTILIRDEPFMVLDVQDYFGKPLLAGRWEGGPVTLPMPDRDPSPEFAAFVVLSGEAIHYAGRGQTPSAPSD